MPISQKDFERACNTYKNNWLGTGQDGNTVAQRFDLLQIGLNAARSDVAALENIIGKIEAEMLTEDRVKELIAEAILAQQPPPEVEPPSSGEPIVLTEGDPAAILLTENGDKVLLTEAAT